MIRLTKEEKKAILFILAVFMAGMAVFFARKLFPALPEILDSKISSAEKINVNSASYEDLTKIKGVGRVTAGRIIDYREKNGPFREKADLMKVKGIGKATYRKMENSIRLE